MHGHNQPNIANEKEVQNACLYAYNRAVKEAFEASSLSAKPSRLISAFTERSYTIVVTVVVNDTPSWSFA